MPIASLEERTDDPAAGSTVDGEAASSRLRRLGTELVVFAGYAAMGGYLLGHLWLHPGSRLLRHSYSDQYQFEWFLGADTHALLGLHNPLFTGLQNAPGLVNMMGNASVLGLALPLLPVTALLGANVSFALAISLGLAGTAFGWYWVLHRDLGLHRLAAFLGGTFCAFAPPIVPHANAHPNLVALFLIPWITRLVVRLPGSRHPLRDGLWLGLLVAYQVFIGEEPLLMAALALGLFLSCFAVLRRGELRAMARPFLTGAAAAVVVALVLLAYPLWVQFRGPGHYNGLGGLAGLTNDLNTLTAYSTPSLGYQGAPLASANYAEENAYFGWPLLLLALMVTIWLWRDRLVRVCAMVGAAFLLCSLGETIRVRTASTGVPGPWWLFKRLPLLDSMNVARFTFVTAVAMGIMLAVATDRVIAAPRTGAAPVRVLWIAALAGALVPVVPLPLPTVQREPVPRFFTHGTYRAYVAPGHTLVPVPPVNGNDAIALRWQVATGMAFRYPEGYFMGPYGPDGMATYGPPASTTTSVIQQVRSGDHPVVLTGEQRSAVLADLRTWRADAIVAYRDANVTQLRATLDPVLGPARQVDDVWLWDVRALTQS